MLVLPETQLGADDDGGAFLCSVPGAVEAEEEGERQEDGAEHERRHGGRHAGAAALGRRHRRRGRRQRRRVVALHDRARVRTSAFTSACD